MTTWRIISVNKWLVTPMYKPFMPFGRGTIRLTGHTNDGYSRLTNWDDPPENLTGVNPVFESLPQTLRFQAHSKNL